MSPKWVEVPWQTPQGQQTWRQAIVLCSMPRLLIVQYKDGKRHLLPREHVRPIASVPMERTKWVASSNS
jgi:hypothetical protein